MLMSDLLQPISPLLFAERSLSPHSEGVAPVLPEQSVYGNLARFNQFLSETYYQIEETGRTIHFEHFGMQVGTNETFIPEHLVEFTTWCLVVLVYRNPNGWRDEPP